MIENDGGAGRPNVWSKTPRSRRIVGEPKRSMIAIVDPLPSMPLLYRDDRLYACRIWAGW